MTFSSSKVTLYLYCRHTQHFISSLTFQAVHQIHTQADCQTWSSHSVCFVFFFMCVSLYVLFVTMHKTCVCIAALAANVPRYTTISMYSICHMWYNTVWRDCMRTQWVLCSSFMNQLWSSHTWHLKVSCIHLWVSAYTHMCSLFLCGYAWRQN